VLFGGPLFGRPLFAFAAPAFAQPSPAVLEPARSNFPGLYAPLGSARTIAIRAAESAAAAAEPLRKMLESGKGAFHTLSIADDPSASDCAGKAYVAVLDLGASIDRRPELGYILDVDLALADCAGWPVNEWHESRVFTRAPGGEAIAQSMLAALLRFRYWAREQPELAESLFARGLAYDEQSVPTYLFSLFKSDDGQMRAYVRPGGPAYAAGLRTGDIVERLDGRFWWEYGTYQSQRRARDGNPHSFVVKRGNRELAISLGDPFRG